MARKAAVLVRIAPQIRFFLGGFIFSVFGMRAPSPNDSPLLPPACRLPTPPEWGPPPAHIFTSWYQPQTIPQPVFRPSGYSRLAGAYGGAQPPGFFPPAYMASAFGGAYGGGGPPAAPPGAGAALYPLAFDPLAASGVLLEQGAHAPMSARRLRAVLAAHEAFAAEGDAALPRFAALAAGEEGEEDKQDEAHTAVAAAAVATMTDEQLQRRLRRRRRRRRQQPAQ